MLPSATGGATGRADPFDPGNRMLYVYSATQITQLGLVPGDSKKSEMRYSWSAPDPIAPPSARQARAAAAKAADLLLTSQGCRW